MKRQRGMRIIICMLILTAIFNLYTTALSEDAEIIAPEPQTAAKAEPSEPSGSGENAEQPETVIDEEPDQQSEPDNSPSQEPQREKSRAKVSEQPPPPKPATEAEKNYTVKWTSAAFSGQTTNYEDQVVLGVDANYALDLQRDIAVSRNGKQQNLKGVRLSCSSSNEKTLYVSADGLVKGKQRGTAQLIVSLEFPDGQQRQLRKHVKVVAAPRIRFAPSQSILENGDTLDLSQYARVPLLMASPNVNADVRFELEPLRNDHHGYVELDASTGRLSVHYEQPGDIFLVTARTYSGEIATFTLMLGNPSPSARIDWPEGTLRDDEGYAHMTPGSDCDLFIEVFDKNGEPVKPQGEWAIDGEAGIVSVDDDGQLQVAAHATAGGIFALTYTDDIGASAYLYLIID